MTKQKQQFSVSVYQLVFEKNIPHTKYQSHKETNHRAHREHREFFSAIVSFFSKPSEKHSCFSEGLLKKEKPGGETAGYLSTGQILAEKD
ncbi:MAG: hypothetical protein ACQETH_14165 [Candidatus Rifleibacteriota bacterium]